MEQRSDCVVPEGKPLRAHPLIHQRRVRAILAGPETAIEAEPVPTMQSLIDRMYRLIGAQLAEMERDHGLPPLTNPRSTAARRRRRKPKAGDRP